MDSYWYLLYLLREFEVQESQASETSEIENYGKKIM